MEKEENYFSLRNDSLVVFGTYVRVKDVDPSTATRKDRKLRGISRVLVNWEKLFALWTKNKRQLCLFPRLIFFFLLWTTVLSNNFIIISFKNCLPFSAKNYLLQSSAEFFIFSLRKFSKEQSNCYSESEIFVEYGGLVRASQLTWNNFCLIIKEMFCF